MIRPAAIASADAPLAEVVRRARADDAPLLVAAPVEADDRGWSIMNQLQGVLTGDGQINFTLQYPGVIRAWHRHEHQVDFWLCVRGHIKVGVHRDGDGASWMAVVGEQHPAMVVIPERLWHGLATVGSDPAGLLYYVSRAYDPAAPDEQRRPFDAVSGFPWTVQHR